MLRLLRIRLTVLYMLASTVLAVALGGGTYSLVNYYFQTTNDQALRVKMGLQFASLDIPLPLSLYEAVKQAGLVITQVPTQSATPGENGTDRSEVLQESELADIYVLPLTLEGGVISDFNAQPASVLANPDAIQSAIQSSWDIRTIQASDGTPVRLLTYIVPDEHPVQVFQVGRYLSSQRLMLKQLLNSLILIGVIITILFGIASWILAGRTLRTSQQAWDKQLAFIANASHELRTPLTLIHAGVEVGLRKAESPEQRQILSDVLADANYMNKLIVELLLLSRLDAQNLELELQPIRLSEFMPEILRQVERLADCDQISVESDLQEVVVIADPIRLKQVLLIVLDNAIRNNMPCGIVHVSASSQKAKATIKIKDSGAGIPPEHLDRVFDRFYRVGDESTSDYKGSGLGLSLAKGLIEAQKGHIELHSVEKEGTEVSLTFPAPATEAGKIPNLNRPPFLRTNHKNGK